MERVLARATVARLAADTHLDECAAVEGLADERDRASRDRGGARAPRRLGPAWFRPRPAGARDAPPTEVCDLVVDRSRERARVGDPHASAPLFGQPSVNLLPLVRRGSRIRDGAEQPVHLRDGVVAEDAGALPDRPGAEARALVDHDRIPLVS